MVNHQVLLVFFITISSAFCKFHHSAEVLEKDLDGMLEKALSVTAATVSISWIPEGRDDFEMELRGKMLLMLKDKAPVLTFPPRGIVVAAFKHQVADFGFSVANVHMPGGRYDDKFFATIPGCKRDVIKVALQYDPDIILGDFNSANPSHPADTLNYIYGSLAGMYANTPYTYTRAEIMKYFDEYYFGAHHEIIRSEKYHLPDKFMDQPTDFLNANTVDFVYNKPNVLTAGDVQALPAIPSYDKITPPGNMLEWRANGKPAEQLKGGRPAHDVNAKTFWEMREELGITRHLAAQGLNETTESSMSPADKWRILMASMSATDHLPVMVTYSDAKNVVGDKVKVLTLNVQFFLLNVDNLKKLVEDSGADIIAVQESWYIDDDSRSLTMTAITNSDTVKQTFTLEEMEAHVFGGYTRIEQVKCELKEEPPDLSADEIERLGIAPGFIKQAHLANSIYLRNGSPWVQADLTTKQPKLPETYDIILPTAEDIETKLQAYETTKITEFGVDKKKEDLGQIKKFLNARTPTGNPGYPFGPLKDKVCSLIDEIIDAAELPLTAVCQALKPANTLAEAGQARLFTALG